MLEEAAWRPTDSYSELEKLDLSVHGDRVVYKQVRDPKKKSYLEEAHWSGLPREDVREV